MRKLLTSPDRSVSFLLLVIGAAVAVPFVAAEGRAQAGVASCPDTTTTVPVTDWTDAPATLSDGTRLDLSLTDDFGTRRTTGFAAVAKTGTVTPGTVTQAEDDNALILGVDPKWASSATSAYPERGSAGDYYDTVFRLNPPVGPGGFVLAGIDGAEAVQVWLNNGEVPVSVELGTGLAKPVATSAPDGSLALWPASPTLSRESGGEVRWTEPVRDITIRLFTRMGADPDRVVDGVTVHPVTACVPAELGLEVAPTGPVEQIDDGVFDVSLAYTIHNSGTVGMEDLKLQENLQTMFEPYESLEVRSVNSEDAPINPRFDGVEQLDLLAPETSLDAGAIASVELIVRVEPTDCRTPFATSALVSTEFLSDGDVSRSRLDAAAVPGGAPGLWSFGGCAQLAVAHWVSESPKSDDGDTYRFELTTTITNDGDSPVSGLQATNDLDESLARMPGFTVESLTAEGLSVNRGFDGASNVELLRGTDTLAAGQTALLVLALSADPAKDLGPFRSVVTATGADPRDRPLIDLSTEGSKPDPDGDGRPGEAEPTTIRLPRIGVALNQPAPAVLDDDGSYRVRLDAVVTNSGSTMLEGLQLRAPLVDQLTGVRTVQISSVVGDGLNVDPQFNAGSRPDTLSGSDRLNPGDSATVSIEMSIDPSGSLGPHQIQMQATGSTPPSETSAPVVVEDLSNDGLVADSDSDGNTADNDRRTRIALAQLGSTLELIDGPRPIDGGHRVRLAASVANSGSAPLLNPQVELPLAGAFGEGVRVHSVRLADTRLTTVSVDPGYDGQGTPSLLRAGGELGTGTRAVVIVELDIDEGAGVGPFALSASSRAEDAGGAELSDVSQSGTDPDADGDRTPTNDSEPTRFGIPRLVAEVEVVAAPQPSADGSYTFELAGRLINAGTAPLDRVRLDLDLGTMFSSATAADVVSLQSVPIPANPLFDGDGETGVLITAAALEPGEENTISAVVRFVPEVAETSQELAWEASAMSGQVRVDSFTSEPGAKPTIDLARVGLSNSIVSGPEPLDDGSYRLTYRTIVHNTGTGDLQDIQVTDPLAASLSEVSHTVVEVTGNGLTPNPTFDGAEDTALLQGTDVLEPGGQGQLDVDIILRDGPWDSAFDHQSIVSATGKGIVVSDASTVGQDPSPDGDHNPLNDSAFLPIAVPHLTVTESVVRGPLPAEDDTFGFETIISIANRGAVELDSLQLVTRTALEANIVEMAARRSSDDDTTDELPIDFRRSDTPDESVTIADLDPLAPGESLTLRLALSADPDDITSALLTSVVEATSAGPDDQVIALSAATGVGLELALPKLVINHSLANPHPTIDPSGSFLVEPTIEVINEGAVTLQSVRVSLAAESGRDAAGALGPGSPTLESLHVDAEPPVAVGRRDVDEPILVIDELAPGERRTVTASVRVGPTGDLSPRRIMGIATAVITDVEAGDHLLTTRPENVLIAAPVTMALTTTVVEGPMLASDGRHEVAYLVELMNPNTIELTDVQLSHVLDEAFPETAQTEVLRLSSDELIVNESFEGRESPLLLSDQNSLAPGASAAVTVRLAIEPGPSATGFRLDIVGTASVAGRPEALRVRSLDARALNAPRSESTDDRPDDDRPDDTGQTRFDLPRIGLASQLLDGPTRNEDGTLTLTLALTAANLGLTSVDDVQIELNLNRTFAGVNGFVVESIDTGGFEANPNYDGSRETNLLGGGDSIPPGDTRQLRVTVNVEPGRSLGPFEYQATLFTTSSTGATITDLSVDGADVDPDGDGNPYTDNGPTHLGFEEGPAVTMEIIVADPILVEQSDDDEEPNGLPPLPELFELNPRQPDRGPHLIALDITLANVGDVPISDLSAELDLRTVLAGVDRFDVLSAEAEGLDLSPRFDGRARTNLFANDAVLATGAEGQVHIELLVDPNTDPGPFDLGPSVVALSPSGKRAEITLLDSDTLFDFGEHAELAAMASVQVGPVKNSDGSWSLTYEIGVTNTGNVPVDDVRLASDLSRAFPTVIEYSTGRISSDDAPVNHAFDGQANLDLLPTGVEIQPAQTISVQVPVVVVPGPGLGPFVNVPVATGRPRSEDDDSRPERQTPADSDDYVAPPPSVSSQAHDDNRPSSVTFGDTGEIALGRALSPAKDGPNGERRLALTFTLHNAGAGALADVETNVDLSEAITDNRLRLVSVDSDDLTVEPSFDGVNQTALLIGRDPVAAGSTASVRIILALDDSTSSALVPHLVEASATSSNGATVTAELDPAGAPSLAADPKIGAAMSVQSGPTLAEDGSWTMVYLLHVTNAGTVALHGVQATENVAGALASLGTAQITDLVGEGLTVAPDYDGSQFGYLLSGNDTLEPGQSGSIEIEVRLDPIAPSTVSPLTTVRSTASVSGISATGSTAVDSSQAGVDMDPDRDQNPVGDDQETVTVFGESASLSTTADIASPIPNDDGTFTVLHRIVVTNTGQTPLSDVSVLADIRGSLGGDASVVVEAATSRALKLNPAFDAWSDARLAVGAILDPGESANLDFSARIDPGDRSARLRSPVRGSAISPNGMTVGAQDRSSLHFPLRSLPKVDLDLSVAGEGLALVVDVVNNGDGRAAGPIQMGVELPPGLTATAERGRGWICERDSSPIACNHPGPLNANAGLPSLELALRRDESIGDGVLNVSVDFSDDETAVTATREVPNPLPGERRLARTSVDHDTASSSSLGGLGALAVRIAGGIAIVYIAVIAIGKLERRT